MKRTRTVIIAPQKKSFIEAVKVFLYVHFLAYEVKEMDPEIGGRTAEIAKEILKLDAEIDPLFAVDFVVLADSDYSYHFSRNTSIQAKLRELLPLFEVKPITKRNLGGNSKPVIYYWTRRWGVKMRRIAS